MTAKHLLLVITIEYKHRFLYIQTCCRANFCYSSTKSYVRSGKFHYLSHETLPSEIGHILSSKDQCLLQRNLQGGRSQPYQCPAPPTWQMCQLLPLWLRGPASHFEEVFKVQGAARRSTGWWCTSSTAASWPPPEKVKVEISLASSPTIHIPIQSSLMTPTRPKWC